MIDEKYKNFLLLGSGVQLRKESKIAVEWPHAKELELCDEFGHKFRPYQKTVFEYCLRCRIVRLKSSPDVVEI